MTNYNRSQGQKGRFGSKKEQKVVLSFEYLDIQQGQTFKQWDDNKDLLKLMALGHILNKLTVSQVLAQKLIIQYDTDDKKKWNAHNMPKTSKWKYPNTLQKNDVPWAKVELGRKLRVIGYLENNVFCVIFLDNKHQFFPSSTK